jgi:hypothetical protein
MLETLKSWVEVGLVIAVLVMFFGLVARSNVRAARVIGWFSIAWGLTVAIIEAYGWYDKGDWLIVPARQFWHQIDRGSLNAFESVMERYFPSAIDLLSQWVLNWPAWLVLGIIGLGFLLYDHLRFVQTLAGRRPAPAWKRALAWLREAVRPKEEQA